MYDETYTSADPHNWITRRVCLPQCMASVLQRLYWCCLSVGVSDFAPAVGNNFVCSQKHYLSSHRNKLPTEWETNNSDENDPDSVWWWCEFGFHQQFRLDLLPYSLHYDARETCYGFSSRDPFSSWFLFSKDPFEKSPSPTRARDISRSALTLSAFSQRCWQHVSHAW